MYPLVRSTPVQLGDLKRAFEQGRCIATDERLARAIGPGEREVENVVAVATPSGPYATLAEVESVVVPSVGKRRSPYDNDPAFEEGPLQDGDGFEGFPRALVSRAKPP